MNNFTFESSYTWRKAGFILLSNSLAYREVINANPGWDITSSPSPGTLLNKPLSRGTSGMGTFPIASDLFPSSGSEVFYPFDSRDSYIEALAKYSPAALKSVEECNGYSSTSTRVITEQG